MEVRGKGGWWGDMGWPHNSRGDDALNLLVLRYNGGQCGIHCAYISNLPSSSWKTLDCLVAMND